jgi:hypothetical protein
MPIWFFIKYNLIKMVTGLKFIALTFLLKPGEVNYLKLSLKIDRKSDL